MATWAIANQKGGVGKTAATLGLAAATAHFGAKVLVVDLDPQASASKVLGVESVDPETRNVSDVMLAHGTHPIDSVTVPVPNWGFDLAPTDLRLAMMEQSRTIGVEHKLRNSIAASETPYDVVFIDCPPSLGMLTINSLAAATHVLVVTAPAYAAMRGLADLLLGSEIIEMGQSVHQASTIEAVTTHFNPGLDVAGFVLNLDEHTTDAKSHAAALRDHFSEAVWVPAIPKRAAMARSYTHGLPLYRLDPNQGGCRQLIVCFEALAEKLLAHQGTPRTKFEPPAGTDDQLGS